MTEPLPYVVKLRTVTNEDAPPVVSEVRCLAYGPMEACMQAMMQTIGNTGDNDKCRVETVGPDMEAWRRMRAEEKVRDGKK